MPTIADKIPPAELGDIKETLGYDSDHDNETNLAHGITIYQHAIKVGIARFYRLAHGDARSIWTEDLQSCFPVVYIYKNKDIALHHANSAALPDLDPNNLKELEEVIVYRKTGKESSTQKADGYTQNLKAVLKTGVKIITREVTHCSKLGCARRANGTLETQPSYEGEPVDFKETKIEIIKARPLQSTYYDHYIENANKGREHYRPVNSEKFHHLKEEFKTLRGDYLKSQILKHFKERIENVHDQAALHELKAELQKTDEYKVLATSQGRFTRYGHTDSVKAFDKMFAEQELNINRASSSHPTAKY